MEATVTTLQPSLYMQASAALTRKREEQHMANKVNENMISGVKAGDIITRMLSDAELRPTRDYYKECFNFVRKNAKQNTVGEGHAFRNWYDEASVREVAAEFIATKKNEGQKGAK